MLCLLGNVLQEWVRFRARVEYSVHVYRIQNQFYSRKLHNIHVTGHSLSGFNVGVCCNTNDGYDFVRVTKSRCMTVLRVQQYT